MNRRSIALVVAGVIVVAAAITFFVVRAGDSDNPDTDISADRSNVFGHPGQPSTQPLPTGRPATVTADFVREPCAVVTVEELGVALAQPFHLVSGTFLRRDRPPAVKAGGCGYSFIADGSDAAETYHQVEVTVTQQTADGAKLMTECLARTGPIPYGKVDAGDQACLSAGSKLVIKLGANHYSINVAATPPRADRRDEDAELAPMVKAAAKLFATRLPSG
ncbi:MAG TPA: hypothetical protein VF062_03205 [Candidatus Limnocylindrales bacterium]